MRSLLGLLVALVLGPAQAGTPLYTCPDAPLDPTVGTTLVPWTIARYEGGVYTDVLTVPCRPHVDALHKMDRQGDWLLSVESASDLAGSLAAPAEPRDVIHYDAAAATYSLFFCGGSVGGAVPAGVNVDAILLDGGDGGDLWVSFDVPATIAAATYEPGDLVAYRRTGPGCDGWTILETNPAFDASAAGTGIPVSSNVVGADKIGGTILVTLDVPTDLGPPGTITHTGNRVLSWDGAVWSVWESLAGWTIANAVEGLSWVGNPGRIPATLVVGKSTSPPGSLTLAWTPSCSGGATDYGIYEGALGSWYSHVPVVCTDSGGDLTESIVPAAGNRYYLVVPRNPAAEGSYGARSGALERPPAAGACAATQVISSCP